jgi:GNAT superfamily N-acetyltransferase
VIIEPYHSPEQIVEVFYERVRCDGELAGRVETVAHPYPGAVELAAMGVHTEHQGRGLGRRILGILADLCDQAGCDLRVIPKPLEALPGCRESMTREQLTDWYRRAGFSQDDGDLLIRKPRAQ